MILSALTDRAEIASSWGVLAQMFRAGAVIMRLELGFHGGALEADVFWHPEYQIWAATQELDNRYWCGFGLEPPGQLMGIACEINIPYEGINRRVAGALGRTESQAVYLLHSGKVGGGKPGIGKSAFLAYYGRRPLAAVEWPDGQRTQAVPIGQLDDPQLLSKISDFVRLVLAFKAKATGNQS
jgi:hypothetical protein